MNDLPLTRAAIEAGLANGLHIGAQLFVMIDSHPIADLAFGQSRLDPLAPMTPDTLMLWLSAGKPITAAAIIMLVEQNRLALDDPIAQHIPEFANHTTCSVSEGRDAKESITLRHLLTHTAGLRALDTAYPFATWDETLQKIYAMKLERNWVPGLKAGYHTHTTWYILGELINRLTQTPHDQWIRQNLLEPLHMTDTFLALTPEQYRAYGPRIGFLYDTAVQPPRPLSNYDTELAAARPRPSASCRGPIKQLANFYEMLRNAGQFNARQILRPETVAAMTARQRVGLYDNTFQKTIDWSLGLILNSNHYGPGIPYQFGPHASRETFGHGGSQSSTGFCDPRHKLVVTLLFNGAPGEPAHDQRLRVTLKALYEDLGLA